VKAKEWLAEWNRTIGGSRAPAVTGADPYKSPADVFDEMTGATPLVPIDGPDVMRGIRLEPVARERFAEVMDLCVDTHDQRKFIYNESLPWAHCLPDGWVLEKGATIPVEIKIPRPTKYARVDQTGLPDNWFTQCQHNMAVMGVTRIHFCMFNVVTFEVWHDVIPLVPEVVEAIMARERELWEAVQARKRPEVEVQPVELPKVAGKLSIVTTRQAIHAAQRYLEAKQLVADAEEILNTAKSSLIDSAGGAETWEVHDEGRPIIRCYHSEQAGRKMVDTKLLQAQMPDVYLKFLKQSAPSRPFRAYPLLKGQSDA